MHYITIGKPFKVSSIQTLEPGTYVADNVNIGQMMAKDPKAFAEPVYHDPLYTNNNTTLVVCNGAFGDLLLLSPVVKKLQEKYDVSVTAFSQYGSIWEGVAKTEVYPVNRKIFDKYERIIATEGFVDEEEAMSEHMTDLFAKKAGVELADSEKRPVYKVLQGELEFAQALLRKSDKKRIAVHCQSTARNRTHPSMTSVIKAIINEGFEVVVVGAPNEFPFKEEPGLINTTMPGLTFRQSVAVISLCNGFIGPDSSLIHAAGALGVPAVGLYAAFPWQLRTKYCPTTHVLQGKTGCEMAPCFYHARPIAPFPEGGPCIKTGYCNALSYIGVDRIVSKLKQII